MRFTKQVFIGLSCFSKSLSRIVNTPDRVKSVSINNQKCMTEPTLTDLHPY